MKKILFFLLLMLSGCAMKKTFDKTDIHTYYPIGSENSTFNYTDSNAFVNHKDISRTKQINGKSYSTRIIEYSWGKKVETFYRIENGSVLYYDTKSETENLIMPKNPTVGYTWVNSDQSWEYEIVELNGELETPERNIQVC
ncbi:membrane lipoprotein lipid attachment site-containing protein [Salinimicrobium xinjiangense]|uniref:membrane lipoprotein lipid attachment site-containing protein n=1 Tax=Salinimicrobium xinjiangense TaxID=438596 RepID=UPI000423FA7F|nr:membrane lipoprotein lipid attachment site-containing protein [Salinimicrobium xinjiangense]